MSQNTDVKGYSLEKVVFHMRYEICPGRLSGTIVGTWPARGAFFVKRNYRKSSGLLFLNIVLESLAVVSIIRQSGRYVD